MMKKVLLFLFSILASIGVKAGTSTGNYSSPNVTITINDDADLENFTCPVTWQQTPIGLEVVGYTDVKNIIIKGTISSKGIESIFNEVSKVYNNNEHTLDLTEASITDGMLSVSNRFIKILFAPGTTLPAESILKTGTGLSYAYSADDKSKEGVEINLYVGSVTSLNDITELDQKTLDANTIVYLTGDINGKIKQALIDKGVLEDNINTPVVVDKTTCSVTGGSVKEDVKKYTNENITTTRIRRILVTGGTLTQEEIDYIATLNVEILNMQDAQYEAGVEWKFPSSVEQLVMPEGTIGHAEFGDLTQYEKLIYAVDGALKRLYLPNHNAAGSFTTELLSQLPSQIATSVEGVAISGPINTTDFANLQAAFMFATMFNLHSATLEGENATIKAFGEKIEIDTNGETKRSTNVDFVAPKGTTADELKTLSECGNIGCSYSVLDDGTFNIYIKAGDRHDLKIAKYESEQTKKAVFISNATDASWNDGKVNTDVIEALNQTKYIVSVDFSQLPIDGNTDAVLSGLTNENCNIKYVRLPDSCPITESTYENTTIEIVSRLTKEDRSDARLENGSESLTVAEIFSNKEGGLASAAEYKNMDVNSAAVMRLKGHINADDLAGLDTENRYMDFTELTTRPDNFSNLSQGKAEYIALPNGVAIPEGITASKGVGSFNTETGEFTFNSKQEGSVLNVLWMLNDLITTEKKITSLVMSGPLNAFDLSNKTQSSLKMSKKTGHLVAELDADDEEIVGGAFNLVAGKYEITSADFSKAVFYENTETAGKEESDMVFSQFGTMNDLASLKLPTSEKQTLIPDECLMGGSGIRENLTELCIPYNYTIIGKKALHNTEISYITTTDANGAIVGNGNNTVTLSANLKEIRSAGNEAEPTFFGSGMDKVTDVYVLAVNAPKCGAHAFTGSLTTGNNGFKGNGAHPIQRSNYINGEQIIAVLHYPHESTREDENGKSEAENYTDTTRKYTLSDETGATDSWGNTLMWPKHDEFWRSYNQAIKGHIWNSWIVDNGTGGVISEYNDANVVENAPTYDQTYQGWHEFVLADNYNTTEYNPQEYFEVHGFGFEQRDWYTLCVPYDLTKSQLLQVMGVIKDNTIHTANGEETASEDLYPDVRTLTHVSRSVNNRKVTFHLSKNLVNGGKNGTPTEVIIRENGQGFDYNDLTDNDPVIKGGYPYLVRPYIPKNDLIKSVGKYVMAVAEDCGYEMGDYTYKNSYLLPTVDWKIHAVDADEKEGTVFVYEDAAKERPFYYHFIGTYVESKVPQYSYYLGAHKDSGDHQFFWANKGGKKWSQYSAIIVGRSSLGYTIPEASEEQNIFLDLTNDNDLIILEGETTEKPEYEGSRMAMFFDESGNTTGIEEINANDASGEINNGRVYNINGQYVGISTDNLPKGIYIKDGKKYVVK